MSNAIAVIHIRSMKDFRKVENRANLVIKGLSSNATIFPNARPTVLELQTETGKLHELGIATLNGSHANFVARDSQSVLLYKLLKQEAVYVNEVAKGDPSIILLSGFDVNDTKTLHPIPGKVVIRRAEFGLIEHSVKFYTESLEYAKYYKIEKNSTPPDPNSWVFAADNLNLYNLIVTNLNRGVETSFRIAGGNSRGWGEWSEPISFIPK